ncbi:hypothetical protein M5D96_009388 [Drosophila gunungcola]|uniref:Uncharacterized protein n=1 Tax=Drosophila gunungcola TaxID=103775 RepID=A0A9P9YJ57_9MUSC|nr:hypothetical protein M5D96_009388 [Drosophila gunungcola]
MRPSGCGILLLLLPLGVVSAVRQLEENQSTKNGHLHSGERQVRRRNNKSNASADHHRHLVGGPKKNSRRPSSVSLESDDYDWLDADTSEAIDSSETTAAESVKSSGESHAKLFEPALYAQPTVTRPRPRPRPRIRSFESGDRGHVSQMSDMGSAFNQ